MVDLLANVADANLWCEACGNSGVVTLKGAVGRYSRGATACRWCQAGRARYQHGQSKWFGTHLETDYRDWHDIEPHGAQHPPHLTVKQRAANAANWRKIAGQLRGAPITERQP